MVKIIKTLVFMALLAQTAEAFPLTAGNGEVNVTLYGCSVGDGFVRLDMSYTQGEQYIVELIDSEDRSYQATDLLIGLSCYSTYEGRNRQMLYVEVPELTEIQRIKVTPKHSDPFMLEWDDVPEAVGEESVLRCYGISKTTNSGRVGYVYLFDIKVTNSGDEILSFGTDDISMRDNFGWVYSIDESPFGHKKLLPGESNRFILAVSEVCEFSRPLELLFQDMVLNVEAWA